MPERYRILGLAAGRNLTLLEAQAREFRPRYLWAAPDADGVPPPELQAVARDVGAEVRPMDDMAADPDGDVLVVGTAGRAGLEPTLTASVAAQMSPSPTKRSSSWPRAGPRRRRRRRRPAPARRLRAQRHLAVPLGRRTARSPPHHPHRIRRRAPRPPRRSTRRRDPRAGAQAPHLEHGREDHHR